jgi:hypothetical protein
MLVDAGILYSDTAKLFNAAITAKNMGVQLSAFGDEREDLPFDLQVGITKKLEKAPFAFSVTLAQLHRFKVGYQDTTFDIANGFSSRKQGFGDHLFNHFTIATHIYLSQNLEVLAGYNRLRRYELNTGSTGNGLNGFSGGLNLRFKKLNFQYAHAWYHAGQGYNQLSIGLDLAELTGL